MEMKSQFKKRNPVLEVWKRLRKNKIAILGMCIVLVLILLALFADVIAPYDPAATDFSARLQMPSRAHWFGTDNLGRDILSRVIYGGRTSLLVATLAELIAMVVGCFFGLTAAYFGGKYEALIMRLNDILMAVPTMLLAICVSADRNHQYSDCGGNWWPAGLHPPDAGIGPDHQKSGICGSGAGHRLQQRPYYAGASAAQYPFHHYRTGNHGRGRLYYGHLRSEFYWAWRTAAHCGVGLYAHRRKGVPTGFLAVGYLPGPGHCADPVWI